MGKTEEDFLEQKKLLYKVFPYALQSARGQDRKRLMNAAREKLKDPELLSARDDAALNSG